jgi:hypothetical protein
MAGLVGIASSFRELSRLGKVAASLLASVPAREAIVGGVELADERALEGTRA